jgi:uncharacterized protein
MLAPIITNNLSQVQNICKTHYVKELYVFGSAARNDYKFYSDIDLLVDFKNEIDNNEFTENFYWFKEELIYIFKKPIDLLFYKKALNTRIKEAINLDKILIYGRKIS